MFAKAKCLSDASGFKKGETYTVLSFCDHGVTMLDADKKVTRVEYKMFNDAKLWDLQPLEDEKKPEPATPAPAKSPGTDGVFKGQST